MNCTIYYLKQAGYSLIGVSMLRKHIDRIMQHDMVLSRGIIDQDSEIDRVQNALNLMNNFA